MEKRKIRRGRANEEELKRNIKSKESDEALALRYLDSKSDTESAVSKLINQKVRPRHVFIIIIHFVIFFFSLLFFPEF